MITHSVIRTFPSSILVVYPAAMEDELPIAWCSLNAIQSVSTVDADGLQRSKQFISSFVELARRSLEAHVQTWDSAASPIRRAVSNPKTRTVAEYQLEEHANLLRMCSRLEAVLSESDELTTRSMIELHELAVDLSIQITLHQNNLIDLVANGEGATGPAAYRRYRHDLKSPTRRPKNVLVTS